MRGEDATASSSFSRCSREISGELQSYRIKRIVVPDNARLDGVLFKVKPEGFDFAGVGVGFAAGDAVGVVDVREGVEPLLAPPSGAVFGACHESETGCRKKRAARGKAVQEKGKVGGIVRGRWDARE